jgi:predicted ATP-dependent endonuclease of OLD family
LLEKVESGRDIVAVEEPENHLHPALQKRLVDRLRQVVTEGKKQILLATHSPFIIDRVNLKSIWFVYTEGLESKAVNITTEKELTNTFWKIGVKPSDFLFANGILVVEGSTDKDVYTDWAGKIGKPFEDVGVLVIDAESCRNITKYLNSEVIQRTTFRLYCLADKDAKWVKEKFGDVVPEENILVLDKGALEDYYPREIVLRFAREMSPKKGRKEEEIPTEIKVGETVTKLNKLLHGDWWKRVLADRVIEEMNPAQIDDEIRKKLGTVWKSLEG